MPQRPLLVRCCHILDHHVDRLQMPYCGTYNSHAPTFLSGVNELGYKVGFQHSTHENLVAPVAFATMGDPLDVRSHEACRILGQWAHLKGWDTDYVIGFWFAGHERRCSEQIGQTSDIIRVSRQTPRLRIICVTAVRRSTRDVSEHRAWFIPRCRLLPEGYGSIRLFQCQKTVGVP